jgi:predicted DNA-binding transcriptional regulator YafY
MNPLYILTILKKYSDANHPLSQREIVDLVDVEYGEGTIEVRAVRRNLENLIALGYDIDYTEIPRGKSAIWTDIYYNPDFTATEINLLMDGLSTLSYLPFGAYQEITWKLRQFLSLESQATLEESGFYINHSHNPEVPFTLEVLDEAIRERRKVSFVYNHYEKDKGLYPNLYKRTGEPNVHEVSPFAVIIRDGNAYLIAAYDEAKPFHYLIHLITDVKLLDEKAIAAESVSGLGNVEAYAAARPYMQSGEVRTIRLKVSQRTLNSLISWMGIENVRILSQEEGENSSFLTCKCG